MFSIVMHPSLTYTHSEELLTDRTDEEEFNIIPVSPLYEELNFLPNKVCTRKKGGNMELLYITSFLKYHSSCIVNIF